MLSFNVCAGGSTNLRCLTNQSRENRANVNKNLPLFRNEVALHSVDMCGASLDAAEETALEGGRREAASPQRREQPRSVQNTEPETWGMDEKVQQVPTGIPGAWDSPKGTSSELVTDAASDSRSLAVPAVKAGSPRGPTWKAPHTSGRGPRAHKRERASSARTAPATKDTESRFSPTWNSKLHKSHSQGRPNRHI